MYADTTYFKNKLKHSKIHLNAFKANILNRNKKEIVEDSFSRYVPYLTGGSGGGGGGLWIFLHNSKTVLCYNLKSHDLLVCVS